jgi:hypothetical protein
MFLARRATRRGLPLAIALMLFGDPGGPIELGGEAATARHGGEAYVVGRSAVQNLARNRVAPLSRLGSAAAVFVGPEAAE